MHYWKSKLHDRGPFYVIGMVAVFIIIGLLMAGAFGYFTMWLWNWVIPPVFGLKTISFWQAFALLLLSWIFFGRFRGGHHWHGRHWQRRMMKRWARMTPEERERFVEHMRRYGRHHHRFDPESGGPDQGKPAP